MTGLYPYIIPIELHMCTFYLFRYFPYYSWTCSSKLDFLIDLMETVLKKICAENVLLVHLTFACFSSY